MSMKVFNALLILLGIVYGRTKGKGPCDETRECVREQFTNDDKMLCYGYYGCKGASMNANQKAVCSGAKGCFRAKFSTSVTAILCNGFAACQKGRNMVNNNKIACNGLRACYDIVGGITAPKILCDGDVTCTNMKPGKTSNLMMNLNAVGNGDQSLLYCNGNGACKETQQRSDGLIYCDGDGACQRSRMQAPNIECMGKRVCKDAIIQPPTSGAKELLSLDCAGWFGCSTTEIIQAQSIKAYGFNALAGAIIETRGTDMVLKAYGFRALAGASIDCKGSTCTIDCKGNACKNVPISVARSSTLIMTPPECDPKNPGYVASKKDPTLPGKIQGINCPIIKHVTATETEEEVAAWRQSFVEEWKLSEEYQEMIEMNDIADQEFDKYMEDRLRDYEDLQAYDYEDGDDEYFAQQDEMMMNGESSYLFGGKMNIIDSLKTEQELSGFGLIATNLITALAVFLLTGGLIYCYVQYKFKDALYKQLPQ